MSQNPEYGKPVEQIESSEGVSRRRLMRASLASAPVILAVKSQSVLAAEICIKPSAFSSVQAAGNTWLSHTPNSEYYCKSHGHWRTTAHPAPYNVASPNKAYFLKPGPNFVAGVVKVGGPRAGSIWAGFTTAPSGIATTLTLQDVLISTGGGVRAFARHVVGTFLTAVAYDGGVTSLGTPLLTQAQCRTLWDLQGAYDPFTGANWNMTKWLEYFDYIYGP